MIIKTKQFNKKNLKDIHFVFHTAKLVGVALSLGFFSKVSIADDQDTFQPYASLSRLYDNNLFRRSVNASSDQITTVTAGIRVNKPYGMQRLIADVGYNDFSYQNNTFLSYSALNYNATLIWSLTPDITGSATTLRKQSLATFADFRGTQQNIQTYQTNQFRAQYSPHDVWGLIVGVTNDSLTNSQTFTAINDYQATGLDYGVRYKYPSETTLTFLGHHRNGQYNKRPLDPVLVFDNGYSEDEYELRLLLKATGKSNLTAKISYLSREFDHFTSRNYNVVQGDLNYDYLLTGKIKASLDLSRVAGQFVTNYSTYAVADTANLTMTYNYSEKLIFSMNGRLAQREFRVPVVANVPLRNDHEESFGGKVLWQPTQNVGLSLSSVKSTRNASAGYNNFDYHDLTTTISLDLKM